MLKWLITTTRRDAWATSSRARREEPATYADVRDLEPDETAPSPETAVLTDVDDRLVWQHFATLPERCKSLLRVIAFAERPTTQPSPRPSGCRSEASAPPADAASPSSA